MTYDALERSADQGRPVEIYTFARGDKRWRYTSAAYNVTVDGDVYERAAIKRPNFSQGAELNRSALRLQVARDFPLAALFRAGMPVDAITLRIQQYHAGDDELAVLWSGRLINCALLPNLAELTCEPVFTSIRQIGLRRRYQRQCPHVLYGAACKVSPASVKLTAEAEAVAGVSVTAALLASQPDGWWEGGYLQYAIEPGVLERRFIFAHTGDTVELTTQPLGLEVGMDVDFFPGCDHTLATCHEKFENRDNYGGFPDIPLKNPFGPDPVY